MRLYFGFILGLSLGFRPTYQLGDEAAEQDQIYAALNSALQSGSRECTAFWEPLPQAVEAQCCASSNHVGKQGKHICRAPSNTRGILFCLLSSSFFLTFFLLLTRLGCTQAPRLRTPGAAVRQGDRVSRGVGPPRRGSLPGRCHCLMADFLQLH